jgi:4-hydroxy-3-polyprenylbenzoate decarboxylase
MVEESRAGERKEAITVGITGASGIPYGIRTVQVLRSYGYEVHVVYTRGAIRTAQVECGIDLPSVLKSLAAYIYEEDELEAPISSSSFLMKGMIVSPCSIRTLAEIASGIASNLVSRTALNVLRVKGRLVLVLRETPLGTIELRNALQVSRAGGIIMPASPAFYTGINDVSDIVDFIVGKSLDLIGVRNTLYKRWNPKIGPRPCGQASLTGSS